MVGGRYRLGHVAVLPHDGALQPAVEPVAAQDLVSGGAKRKTRIHFN